MTSHSTPLAGLRNGLKRAADRLWSISQRRLQAFTRAFLVIFAVAVFGLMLALTLMAAFGKSMPYWLFDELQLLILAGNEQVGLTLEYLIRWGITELLREVLAKVVLVGIALLILLIVARTLLKLARFLPWALGSAKSQAAAPRIRLTRALSVSVIDSHSKYNHQFDMHVDLVLKAVGDTHLIIGQLSVILPAMLRSAQDVVRNADADVNTGEMARFLTHAARKCDKRIRRVELRDVAYTMIDPKTGNVMFSQILPVTGT